MNTYVQTGKWKIRGNETPNETDTWVTPRVPVLPENGFPDVAGHVTSWPATAPTGQPGGLRFIVKTAKTGTVQARVAVGLL